MRKSLLITSIFTVFLSLTANAEVASIFQWRTNPNTSESLRPECHCTRLDSPLLFDTVMNQGVKQDALREAFAFFDENLRQDDSYFTDEKTRITNTAYMTLIDYSLPSSEKRLYLINLYTGEVTKQLVAHGKFSGLLYAKKFSDIDESFQSSLGFFVTADETYEGDNGLSIRMHGQSKTNLKAYTRNIVIHSAWYANQDFVDQYGYLGRSHGCPAVPADFIKPFLDSIKGGSLVYSFR